jgi:hypothetical protein
MKKQTVIEFADAGTKPNTVMIKAHHTIIAVMAMRGSYGTENVAALAKFHFVGKSISTYGSICLCL